MAWQVVKIGSTSGKSIPFVSIGRGQISFSAVACQLINDNGQFKFAQFLKDKENGKPIIGVKFLEEPDDDSIPIKRKRANGKDIQGMTIVNKDLIKDLFGMDGSNDGTVRRKVQLAGENILKILD